MKLSDKELTVEPDQDLMDLIPDFIRYRRNDIEESRQAIARNDIMFLKRLGHTIKGIARPYGFIYLETLAKNLEAAADDNSLDKCKLAIDEIEYYIDNVKIIG